MDFDHFCVALGSSLAHFSLGGIIFDCKLQFHTMDDEVLTELPLKRPQAIRIPQTQ
jgi:hypothetical protein